MTEITEFLNNINRHPSCLAEVDWREQTGMFYSERICEILVGIEDDDVCNLVMEYIADGWSEAEEFEPFEAIDIFNVSWKVPLKYLLIDSYQIKVWGRCLYDVSLIDMPISQWLPIWWRKYI